MFVDGIALVGTSGADEYLIHFHETHESGRFYYLRLAVPILNVDKEHSYMTTYITYRTDISDKGAFRNISEDEHGIQYEIVHVGHQKDKWVICTNENFEEKMIEFLMMFKEDGLYRKIPEIKELMETYPEAKI